MAGRDFYVYLLIDKTASASPTQGVFYVGKGKGTRFADHLQAAALAEALADATSAAQTADERADDGGQAALSKAATIADLQRRPGDLRVDVLRRGLTEAEALLVESATIDLLGLANLTNIANGHRSGRHTLRAMLLAQNAQQVPLVDPAIVVVPTGLWLECDPIEQLASLDLADVWENAHKIWAVSPANRRIIEQLAGTAKPVLLLAVHKHGGVLGGVVMGEWFIQGMDDNKFIAHPTPAPAKYLHNRLMSADGTSAFTPNQGVRYSESMTAVHTEQQRKDPPAAHDLLTQPATSNCAGSS